MMFGTGVAQIIPVVISPILTRIYTPEDFGKYGIYLAIVGILTPVITLRYELAIMLNVENRERKYIMHTAIYTTIIISFVILLIITALKVLSVHLHHENLLLNDLLLIPLSLILIGLYQSLYYWNNKEGNYKLISSSNIFRSAIVALFTIIFGYYNYGYSGLVYGFIIAQIIQLIYIYSKSNFTIDNSSYLSRKRIFVILKKYSNYPKYSSASAIIQSVSSQSPIVVLESLFNSKISGFYYFGQKIINVPITFIGRAVGTVYYKDIADNIDNEILKLNIIKKYYYNLHVLIIPVMAVLFFFGDEIFKVVFGLEWEVAGTYVILMVPWITYNFIALPFIYNFEILNKQDLLTKLNSIALLLRIASLFIGYIIHNDPYYSILYFSIISAIMYYIIMITAFRIIKISNIHVLLLNNILIIAMFFSLTYIIKFIVI